MKLLVQKRDVQNAPTEATLTHNGKQMIWNIAVLEKAGVNDNPEIFEEINSYWSTLPKASVDAIFAIYQTIRDFFDSENGFDLVSLTHNLTAPIEGLCKYHALTDLRHWIDFKSNLVMPHDLNETFDENSPDNRGTRERTYLREDYRQLLALALATRFMLPIWGEFISRTRNVTGSTYKEFYASKLMMRSSIGHSEAMARLRVYIEQSIPADKSKTPAVLGGIGTEEFPDWMLGLILVRRMTVLDMRGLQPETNLVKAIYRYVHTKSRQHDNNFIGVVREKNTEGSGTEANDNNVSSLESYKIKQEFSAGEIAVLVYYVEDVWRLAQRVCPDIPYEILRMSESSVQVMIEEPILLPQVTLIQWVLSQVVPPRGINYLPKLSLIRAMAATQALLWHKGQYELAGLLSAIAQDNSEALQLPGADSRARIPNDKKALLDTYYPYRRQLGGKQKTARRSNPAIESIDLLAASLSKKAWRLTLPSEWVEKLTGNKNNRRYAVPHEIKIKLADLALALQTRSF